ncbi:NAD-glutamate dehydrogenase [Natronospirillum operosum]|uniref:NAD-glutamate dehydrogenase n=1 Tax=Natronospirillum operosum TaxID=2759953 RepID=A0A4Z0WC42_9GAMM|nr:NAD-glutamate dehydrogenase [Natronospirillum operosum]TGG95742.1 NAD-glutamate dehydrogenase [Natronospirillum operosum]
MPAKKLPPQSDIVETLKERLQKHVREGQKKTLAELIHRVFDHAAYNDLAAYDMADLAGLTVSLWRHVDKWPQSDQAARVQVFNPNVEEHEWKSGHTCVLILARDIPFVVDSARLALNRLGANIHRLFYGDFQTERTASGQIQSLSTPGPSDNELLVCFEIDHISQARERRQTERELLRVISEVNLVVDDYPAITEVVSHARDGVKKLAKSSLPAEEVEESRVFLDWLLDDHFTFLACDRYEIRDNKVITVADSERGLFRQPRRSAAEHIDLSGDQMAASAYDPRIITFAKSGRRSSVHRPAYSDYVIIKEFNSKGEVTGGYRILGLYTSAVYNDSPRSIPIVRRKIDEVVRRSGFTRGSHNSKELAQILHTFPRDELILSTVEELLSTTMSVLSIQERKQIRVFSRRDPYGKFVTALVYLPREIFNTEIRTQIQQLMASRMDVEGSDFSIYLSESVLARIRFVFKLSSPLKETLDTADLERTIVQMARRWEDELAEALTETLGEEKGVDLHAAYRRAFPSGYRESYSARVAVTDIQRMESLFANPEDQLTLSFYLSQEPSETNLKLKIFHQDSELMLSDLVPVLENFGLRVVDEIPYPVEREDGQRVYIYDFTLLYQADPDLEPAELREIFHDAFINIWYGRAENDAYNQLILGSRLTWREVAMLRGYAHYMKQIRFGISQEYIATTLIRHPQLTEMLSYLFSSRFNPVRKKRTELQAKYTAKLEEGLEQVENLNEDRILRKYMELMQATLRTNFYQAEEKGRRKSYISFKLDPHVIADMPKPRPQYEIFVYSPRVEGVHLRGGKVARGGLRWSDRLEDFRTEVLGLVKAQQVKNAVIVPVGAKGGFVAKQLPDPSDREAFMAEGIACYKTFIQGLLDISDNLVGGDVVPPTDVIRHDEDDPYLVVAADKGTATFSDIANEVAQGYNFWLGDAFASGGSNGYDHKKMGITARGAWVSVQRHFREMNINVQESPITVVGIGDMAGDVFGNGLLSSRCLKLVAAFNHMHIFFDPDPDPEQSFRERERLFKLPRSSWDDYDRKLISKGGGIFSRNAKSIDLSPEVKKLLGIRRDKMTPTELISQILKAEVDLIWNGGIGTYVKASTETHAEVGDKANDNLRVDARDLRARVLGEGGNLGFTQLARVEFALQGGRCYTDFIDNAGGVDCSDHEVNIKILLDELVKSGDLTVKHRNQWLVKMTEEVSSLVLSNNYRQTQAISIAAREAAQRLEEYRRHISTFEADGKLDRALEFLPDDEQISERKAMGQGLVRPELSVLISYSKGDLKEALIHQNAGDDDYLAQEVFTAFPGTLVKQFGEQIQHHRLKREIVATQLANDLFNHMGIVFMHRLRESTGASELEVVKAYVAARDIFGMSELWAAVESMDYRVDSALQMDMMARLSRMVRRASRTLIKNNRLNLEVATLVKRYQGSINELAVAIPQFLQGDMASRHNEAVDSFMQAGISQAVAPRLATCDHLYHGIAIIGVASQLKVSLERAAQTFFLLGDKLALNQFGGALSAMPVGTHWQAMAREALRDDLEQQQQRLTWGVLNEDDGGDLEATLERWTQLHQPLVDRWLRIVREILATSEPEFSMYSVATRELLDLSQSTSGGAMLEN